VNPNAPLTEESITAIFANAVADASDDDLSLASTSSKRSRSSAKGATGSGKKAKTVAAVAAAGSSGGDKFLLRLDGCNHCNFVSWL